MNWLRVIEPISLTCNSSEGVHFSLYYMSSWAWFQWLLLVASLLPSLFLLLGYQTRVSGFLCWIFLTSIQNRNMMVLNGGDDYLRLVLMWCCFLPWNRCFSVDSGMEHEIQPMVLRIILICLQLMGIQQFNKHREGSEPTKGIITEFCMLPPWLLFFSCVGYILKGLS